MSGNSAQAHQFHQKTTVVVPIFGLHEQDQIKSTIAASKTASLIETYKYSNLEWNDMYMYIYVIKKQASEHLERHAAAYHQVLKF